MSKLRRRKAREWHIWFLPISRDLRAHHYEPDCVVAPGEMVIVDDRSRRIPSPKKRRGK